MGGMCGDYEFKTVKYRNEWKSIISNIFKSIDIHFYNRKISMVRLMSIFKK